VVCVHARDMKEPWCLAASDAEAPAGTLIKQYARRWTIEPTTGCGFLKAVKFGCKPPLSWDFCRRHRIG
jgi:hypothetical protein